MQLKSAGGVDWECEILSGGRLGHSIRGPITLGESDVKTPFSTGSGPQRAIRQRLSGLVVDQHAVEQHVIFRRQAELEHALLAGRERRNLALAERERVAAKYGKLVGKARPDFEFRPAVGIRGGALIDAPTISLHTLAPMHRSGQAEDQLLACDGRVILPCSDMHAQKRDG
ncbi:MAG TPA: hypothetical protein VK843_01115 [Planctomycetota bacterium]|nr:hypothetical protein [Planctomycetota bacterium]